MKIRSKLFCSIVVTLVVFGFISARPAGAALKAGAGRMEITPKVGCYLGGYYMLNERSKGVHDPLNARALVLDDGNTRIAIVVMDLVIMSGVMAGEIKDKINAEFGIPWENINVSVEHTHTGPEGYYEEYGKYPKEYVPEMKLDIETKAVTAVRQAVQSLAPATVGYESFTLDGLSHNRHDGDGPTDKTAILLVVKNAAGKPVAGFLNFASHPTVVPAEQLLISGEWTGQFQSLMEQKMGEGSVFLYLQGAAGNIGPGTRDVGDGWAQAKDMAERCAASVFPRLDGVKTSSDLTVAAASKEYTFQIRTRKSASDYSKAAEGRIAEIEASNKSRDEKNKIIGWVRGRVGIESFMQMLFPTMKRIKNGKTKTHIEAMRIGDLMLIAFPGEAITELSIRARKQLAPATVAVLGYSNDHLGYITTKEIYDEGGYEAGMGLVFPEATEEMYSGLMGLAGQLEEKKK